MLEFYLNELDYKNMPYFLAKYLYVPSLTRLKNIGYFCGMDYASKDIYNFSEKITRFDHSLTTALLTYKLTNDKKATIAALFHDVATPCFSHVIDYMNKDYDKQESTEIFTEKILREDKYLKERLKEDNISIEDIINYKKYSIVDNHRPKLCADRLDGIILNAIGWTKNITKDDIKNILKDITIIKNESNELEIGFNNLKVAKKVIDINKKIDDYCHSITDNYMMELLAKITKFAIDKKYIKYKDLYYYNEDELFKILDSINDNILHNYLLEFKNIKYEDILDIKLPLVKARTLSPIVKNKRYSTYK